MARAPASVSPPAQAANESPSAFDFEQAMADLEAVVARLEQADVPLEEAMQSFERGVALTRACQAALSQAEQKVEMLVEDADGQPKAVPFGEDPAE